MGSTITLSGFTVLVIFLLGVGVGWVLGKFRVSGRANIDFTGVNPTPGSFKSVKTTTVRSLTLKCKCGAVWNFREGTGLFAPDTQPIPSGDSFVCPKCGKSIDLKAERQFEAEALAELGGKSKIQD